MSAKLTLDKFEILWWIDGIISGSHIRWGGYERLVNDVWQQLNDDERDAIYTFAKRDHAENMEKYRKGSTEYKHFHHMLARYNPSNQYRVYIKGKTTDFDKERFPTLKGKQPYLDCYLWDGELYINWSCRVNSDIAKTVEQTRYRTCTNDYCMSRGTCQRFIDHQKGDTILEDTRPCKKCEVYIELNDYGKEGEKCENYEKK